MDKDTQTAAKSIIKRLTDIEVELDAFSRHRQLDDKYSLEMALCDLKSAKRCIIHALASGANPDGLK